MRTVQIRCTICIGIPMPPQHHNTEQRGNYCMECEIHCEGAEVAMYFTFHAVISTGLEVGQACFEVGQGGLEVGQACFEVG